MNNRPKLINPACADRAFRLVAAASALLVLVLLAALLIQLGIGSAPAWREFGPGFLVGTEWDPVRNVYGALPAIGRNAADDRARAAARPFRPPSSQPSGSSTRRPESARC